MARRTRACATRASSPGVASGLGRPLGERCRGEPHGMIANIAGPCGSDLAEALAITGKQCPRRLLETAFVAGERRQESIGGRLCLAPSILFAMDPPCLIDEFAQSDRRTSRLPREPFPMPRQERDFAG